MDSLDVLVSMHYFLSAPDNGTILWPKESVIAEIIPLYDEFGNIVAYYGKLENGGYAIVNNNIKNPTVIEFGEDDNPLIRKILNESPTTHIVYGGPFSVNDSDFSVFSSESQGMMDLYSQYPELQDDNEPLTLDDERIRQAIIEFRPRLVVIDPIQAYLGSDSDLQIAGRARKLMRRLGMWAAGYDCAIVLIGHLNKKEGSKGLYRSLGSIDVVAAARSVLQVERDTENPDIRIVHQIKNSLAPTAEDIRFSISADKGFRWLECRPQLFEKQQPDAEPKFDTEQQKAAYWIKHFLEKGDMSANEIYCRLDNEGVSKRVARMVKTEMGIHCYQKKRRWYWSVQLEEGAMNGAQV